jgi:hypothetical protein
MSLTAWGRIRRCGGGGDHHQRQQQQRDGKVVLVTMAAPISVGVPTMMVMAMITAMVVMVATLPDVGVRDERWPLAVDGPPIVQMRRRVLLYHIEKWTYCGFFRI